MLPFIHVITETNREKEPAKSNDDASIDGEMNKEHADSAPVSAVISRTHSAATPRTHSAATTRTLSAATPRNSRPSRFCNMHGRNSYRSIQ